MNKFVALITGLLVSMQVMANAPEQAAESEAFPETCPKIFQHKMKKLHSNKVLNLCEVSAGKPVLLVNTASHCGFTKQFGGIEEIHKKYQDKGLVVIGVSSDSFNQEAEDEEKAAEVCYKNFGVTFTMLATVDVTGDDAHPLFKEVARQSSEPKWNFHKYYINPQGEVVKYHTSLRMPSDKNIEKLLAGKL